MNTVLLITQLGQLILTLGPVAIETALKIKALVEVDPQFGVDVKRVTDEALAADADTLARIDAWRKSVGLATVQTHAGVIADDVVKTCTACDAEGPVDQPLVHKDGCLVAAALPTPEERQKPAE